MSINIAKEEEKVVKFWEEIKAFETSLELSKGRPIYSFYDGPPFATGLPHYGHILAGTIKDTVTRYAHNTGHYVERRFGWDTHGLPVEHEIDKKLGISGKEDVLKMGIDKYNAECRAIVMRYAEAWVGSMTRLGRWIDFKNDYKTLQPSFMESVWWVFRQLFDKGYVYRGYKVMPYSTACTTPLSNFEAQLNYKDVVDPTVVISFPLVDDPSVELLAWTTTPWTLPSHTSLCVNPDFQYCKILDEESGRTFILLENLLSTIYKEPKKAKFSILEKKIPGASMVGWRYKPPFDYFLNEFKDRGFRVIAGSYVTAENGVGIVHQAPAFGEDDYNCAMEAGVIDPQHMPPNPVDERGVFTNQVTDFAGKYVKDAERLILKYLKAKGRVVTQRDEKHNYPYCWRSDTPLLYRAVPSWFVTVKDHVSELLDALEKTYWIPETVKGGRFGNWVANARDWNVSRNRYWGTPVPIWVSDDFEEIICIGSIEELEELSGVRGIKDLHRDSIDKITIPSKSGKGDLHRTEEVFDCWFESGSMPYASHHYPFENKNLFESKFPADFIAEGIDQTRGWFYTLLVLGTLLFGSSPYKTVITHGLVLAADGKKMSKRLKNYPDPGYVMDTYGSDALRMYLISSPVVRGDNLRFQEQGVREVVSKVLLPWFNSFKFLEAQIELFQKTHGEQFVFTGQYETSENQMDHWILATINRLILFVKQEMAAYRLYTVIGSLLSFIEDLTNWYIRFNRKRLKGQNGREDTLSALNILFDALYKFIRMMSAFTPFMSEIIYQSLKKKLPQNSDLMQSVHFILFPEPHKSQLDEVIERRVKRMRSVIELGRYMRESNGISLKTPLKEVIILHHSLEYLDDVKALEQYIKEELNVREVKTTYDEERYKMKYSLSPDWMILGKKLRKDLARVKKALPGVSNSRVRQFMIEKMIEIDGITLSHEDFQVKRELGCLDSEFYKSNTDGDVFIMLDMQLHKDLHQEGLTREFINRIQQLRKKADLKVIDEVDMEYTVLDDPIEFGDAIAANSSLISGTLRGTVKQSETSASYSTEKLIIEEPCNIHGAQLMLRLLNI